MARIEYLFESLGDLAQQLDTFAANYRQHAVKPGITKHQAALCNATAFGYEQAAYMVRNSKIVEIA